MSDSLLPPATQQFLVDAAGYLAGMDAQIAATEKLAASIVAATDAARVMQETMARSGAAGVGAGAGAGAAGGAEARAAAAAQAELTAAEKAAAEAAQFEADTLKLLADSDRLLAESSAAVTDAMRVEAAAMKTSRDAAATLGAEQQAVAAKTTGSGAAMAGFGSIASKALLGVGVAFGYSVDKAMHFNAETTRLYTAAGLTDKQITVVQGDLLKLGNQFGYSGKAMAEAMYHGVSAGLGFDAALKAVGESANLANIHGAKLEDTTYALSSVMKAYNLDAKNATNTAALLNAVVGQGDMRFQDFNQSIKNWTPTAASMGISIQSFGAALAYLTDRGNSAEVASTRLTMGLSMVTAGSKAANTYLKDLGLTTDDLHLKNLTLQKTMEHAGLTTNKIAADLKKPDGIYTALKDLQDAFSKSGLSAEQANQVMAKLFGGGRSDKAIMALMQNLDGVKDKYHQIGTAVGDYGKSSEMAAKTPLQQWKVLEATLQNLATTLGTILMPGATAAMRAVSGVLGPLASFFAQHQTMGTAVGGVAAAFGGLAIAVKVWQAGSAVVTGIQAAVTAVEKFQLMTKLAAVATKVWAAAQWLLDAAMNANPLGLIVIAIIAVVAAVWYAWTHWKGFRDFIIGAWHAIADAAMWLWHNVLEPAWHGIADAAMWLWHSVIKPWAQGLIAEWRLIASVVMWWWHNIVEPAFSAVSVIVMGLWNNWIKPAFGFIAAEFRLVAALVFWWWRNVMEPSYKAVGGWVMWLWNNVIKPYFGLIAAEFRVIASIVMWWWHSIVEPTFHAAGAVVSWWWNSIVRPAFDLASGATRTLGSVFSWLYDKAIKPAFDGIGNAISWVWKNAIKPTFDALVSAAKWVGDTISRIFSGIGSTIDKVSGGINSIAGAIGLPHFAEGGPVPGAPGAPSLAVVHGGEYVLSQQMIANITGKGASNPLDALSTRQVATAASPGGGSYTHVTVVNINNAGSLIAQRDLERDVRTWVLQSNVRNPHNNLSLPVGR